MRLTAICVLLLAFAEPLLIHAKKVVLVFPRQIRRSPMVPWRSGVVHYRKSSPGNDYHRHVYRAVPNHYLRKPYPKTPPYPHGGDDFDQGHESVNHVHIPYGKDISHAVTLGKGYIPFDSIKGSFSLGNQRYPGIQGHRQLEQDYPSTGFSSPGLEYNVPSGPSYDMPHMDSYFSDGEDGGLNSHERRNDRDKFYVSRSIEKNLGGSPHMDLNSVLERGKEQRPAQTGEIYKDGGLLLEGQRQAQEVQQGRVLMPAGVPPATIGGSKDGIVFRDIVALDEYHKKLQEMTKSWPTFLTGGGAGAPDQTDSIQQQLYAAGATFPTAGLPGSGFTGPADWLSEFAQPKQGYAVKEEPIEPAHDFRNMPIRTTPFQTLPLNMNLNVPPLGQSVHG